jgi:hypothetical protein
MIVVTIVDASVPMHVLSFHIFYSSGVDCGFIPGNRCVQIMINLIQYV